MDIKINNKFQFSDDTYGLPDHFFKDELGNVSSIVFRQLLGMDRRKFKVSTKSIDKSKKYTNIGQLKKEPLIDLYSTQDFRRECFKFGLIYYLENLADNSSKGIYQIMAKNYAPNIELIILDEYARDIINISFHRCLEFKWIVLTGNNRCCELCDLFCNYSG